VPVTNFRLASTHRRFDEATQTWTDSGTNWFSVAAFRQLGEHAKASLRTGDSVIVTGRLRIRDWESNDRHGTSVDIEADAIGHDLRWGTTAYRPQTRSTTPRVESPGSESAEAAERGTGAERAESGGIESAPLNLEWAVPSTDAEVGAVSGRP